MPESLSTPKLSWVKSFDPIENPSKYSRYCFASIALLGTSHIIITLSPFSPFFKPNSSKTENVSLASSKVLTKGIIICIFVNPCLSLAIFTPSHSSSKHFLKVLFIYRDAPLNPIIGFSSFGSYKLPPNKFAYSLDLKSDSLTITGFGEKATPSKDIPSASFDT